MYCSKCGSPIIEGVKFCATCGTPVQPPVQQPFEPQNQQPNPQSFQQPVQQPFEPQNQPPNQQSFQQAFQQQNQSSFSPDAAATKDSVKPASRKMSPALIIVIVVIGVALLAVAIWAAFSFLGKDKPEDKSAEEAVITKTAEQRQKISMRITQIDNENFPDMVIYARILDDGGIPLSNVNKKYFTITEFNEKGDSYIANIDDMSFLSSGDAMSINLVLDQSGSMDSEGKMSNAKNAASVFLEKILDGDNNLVEITSFDDYVYNRQPFTDDANALQGAISTLIPGGETAFYDAVYAALQQTNRREGSRCVIAFTDGQENASAHSYDDVVKLSRLTGIPVYIIGVGSGIDENELTQLAIDLNGEYFSVNTADLSNVLAGIYEEIYADQRSMFKISYTSKYKDNPEAYLSVRLEALASGIYQGEAELEYVPDDKLPEIDTSYGGQIDPNLSEAELLKLYPNLSDVEKAYYFMIHSFVLAVNAKDFSLMADTLDPDGGHYDEQRQLIEYYREINVRERFDSYDIVAIRDHGDGTCSLTVVERFVIQVGSKDATLNEYEDTYLFRKTANGWKLVTLESLRVISQTPSSEQL